MHCSAGSGVCRVMPVCRSAAVRVARKAAQRRRTARCVEEENAASGDARSSRCVPCIARRAPGRRYHRRHGPARCHSRPQTRARQVAATGHLSRSPNHPRDRAWWRVNRRASDLARAGGDLHGTSGRDSTCDGRRLTDAAALHPRQEARRHTPAGLPCARPSCPPPLANHLPRSSRIPLGRRCHVHGLTPRCVAPSSPTSHWRSPRCSSE